MQKSDQRSKTSEEHRWLYKTRTWKTLRLQILTRDNYTCQRCGVALTQGRTRPTDAVVNHIKPHKGDEVLFADPLNLEAVCKRCHDSLIQSEERRTSPDIGPDGWPIDLNTHGQN